MTPLEATWNALSIALLCGLVGIRMRYRWLAGWRAQWPAARQEGRPWLFARLALTALVGAITAVHFVAPERLAFVLVPLPGPVRALGLPIGVAALWLLWASHRALGRYFSPSVKLRSDHTLVVWGPYARVRHPIYLSYLAFFLGVGLLTANVALAFAGESVILLLLLVRLPREEALLEARYGPVWQRYVRNTPALLPRLGQPAPSEPD